MFISHKHQLIYFEVPRTGSNSVTQTLNGLDPESPTVVGRELHGSYRDYHHFTEEAGKHPEYRLIAGHRNPYDRLWSFWKHRKQTGNPSAFRTISWARYIDWVCEPASSKEVAGALLDVPIAEMLDIAKVGFWLDFHRMEASWAQLCDELDVPLVALARVNVSPDHGEMQSAYTKGMAERVAKRFAEDFAYFGYGLDSWRSGEALEGRVL